MMQRIFNSPLPALVYNPPRVFSLDYFQSIHRAGVLPVLDTEFMAEAEIEGAISRLDAAGFPFGIRLSTVQAARIEKIGLRPPAHLDLLVLAYPDPATLASYRPPVLDCKLFFEVRHTDLAEALGRLHPHALVVRGNEAPGPVSGYSSFILLQHYLESGDLPVLVHGGVGWHTASGLFAAGAAGIVLDDQLYLTAEAPLAPEVRELVAGLQDGDTEVVGRSLSRQYRFFAKLGTRVVRDLKVQEAALAGEADADARLYETIASRIGPMDRVGEDPLQQLFYLGQDAAFAGRFVRRGDRVAEVIRSLFQTVGRRLSRVETHDPMTADTPLARVHGTRYPIIQGPMANISDNAAFARAVHAAGALPFFALASLPTPLADDMLAAGKAAVPRFGAGLIGIEALNRALGDHLELVRRHQAPFAVFAAGTPGQVQALEADGIRTYLHVPTSALLENAIAGGCRRFVFEGGEAGGHVGSLSSLVLWDLAMDRLLALEPKQLETVTAVFAGGIATCRASHFISGMTSELAARGARVGIQVGSAYLFTEEIVASGALKPLYQKMICEQKRTVLMGSTVGLASRTVPSAFSRKMVEEEFRRLGDGEPLSRRKEAFEKDNLGSLLIAAKGCCPDFALLARGGEVCLKDYDEDQQCERGNFMVGDALVFADRPCSLAEVHRRFFQEKKGLFAALDALEAFSGEDRRIHDDVAVIAMGGIFPRAPDLATFWENIVSRKYAIAEMPSERLDPDLYWDPDRNAPDKTYTRLAGQVVDFTFDHEAFGYTPEKAAKLSRSQQMVLAAAFQAAVDADCLDAAGKFDPAAGARTAVIVATCLGNEMANDLHLKYYDPEIGWHLEQIEEFAALGPSEKTRLRDAMRVGLSGPYTHEPVHGVVLNMEAARIAHHLGATGVNYTVDAACASSLAALDCAVDELLSGACDQVLVGGVNTHLAPESFVGFSKMGALSATGSHPFDKRADGFVLGEGAGVVILKRMRDALRDGDRIRGVIRAVGSSSDGRGKAIAAPNPAGQALALDRCFAALAGRIVPEDVDYVEAHGTSTVMGDRAEMETLARTYGASPTGISSVKSQIGHLLGGAGMAGLIKAILALEHATLPPNGRFAELAHRRKFDRTGLYVIAEAAPWPAPEGRPRRAGVSSYGFGGINYHCVVEAFEEGYVSSPRKIFSDPARDADADRIVVAGLGVVLPGAPDVEAFWQRLIDGRSAVTGIPDARFHNDAYARESEASGYRIPKVRAGIVADHRFDNRRYRIPPKTAGRMDRAQCFALDAAAQALAQAGLTDPLPAGNRTAVILGTIPGERQAENVLRVRTEKVIRVLETAPGFAPEALSAIAAKLGERLRDRYPENTEDTIPGLLSNIISGRIANVFGCNGANFVVDASCASSTKAIDLAVQGLRSGRYDCVVTGGADANLYPAVMLAFKRLGLLAEGEAAYFDKKANGYVMGEGAAVQVLTTYRHAKENRMPVIAEICASAFGSSVTDHLLSPSDRVYAETIRATYRQSAVGRHQIRHLDVFAGSNPFLDAVEKEAVERTFPQPLSFGNVKPQFGYFKSANPAVVLTKLALMASRRTLLANPGHRPETSLVGQGSVLRPAAAPTVVSGRGTFALAANVNGIGGVHGHLVVAGMPPWLQSKTGEIPSHIAASTHDSGEPMKIEELPAAVEAGRNTGPGLGVLLSGQGAQHPGMMAELYREDPTIRRMMDRGNRIFTQTRGHNLLDLMFGEDDRLNRTENTQPAVFLASAAIWARLEKEGMTPPERFIGHSVGEYTALYCAGMVDFDTAMDLILTRSILMQQAAAKRPGKIMVVFADAAATEGLVAESKIEGIYLANKNSGRQTAVSGTEAGVDRFCGFLKARSVTHRRLNLSGAFHSPLFEEAAAGMVRALERVSFAPVDFSRVVSNATAAPYPADPAAVKDLLVRQIVSPVEFVAAVSGARGDGVRRFVEVGPAKLLVNLLGHMDLEDDAAVSAVDPRRGQIAAFDACCRRLAQWGALPVRPEKMPGMSEAPLPAPSVAPMPEPADEADFEDFLKSNGKTIRSLARKEFERRRREAAMAEVERFGFYTGAVVVAGVSVGLPGTGNKVFDDRNFDRILTGQNLIEPLSSEEKERIVDMNITRVFKEPDGNARLVKISSTRDVIQLAGKLGYFNLKSEYGIEFDYDITNKLAIAAGIEALKDAQLPLVMRYRRTSTGKRLPGGYSLPEEMLDRTGVILTSLFPGFETLIDEMNNYYYNKFYVRPYKELENIYYHLMESVTDTDIKEQITDWFFKIRERRKRYGNYRFDRALLFDLTPLGSAHFAQLIGARGPNMQMSGACASTTQAVGVAEDWIRTGRCDRVIIIGGEAATSETQGPWIASGFLALGAATVKSVVAEAAKPFDARRNGTILGSGAVSVIVERQDTVHRRGMRGQAEILGSYLGNSAYHGTRIDVDHVGGEMARFVRGVEKRHGLAPEDYAGRMVFMSHETFTPARGGSADAEVTALRRTFPDHYRQIRITNTKGFTGHTLGAAIEDAVMVKAMQTGTVPPIANLTDVPENFADLNFSRTPPAALDYGLHFAAGFGSHFAFLFLRRIEEAQTQDNPAYHRWLAGVSGARAPELALIHNTLCVAAAEKLPVGENPSPPDEPETKPAVAAAAPPPPAQGAGLLGMIRGIIAEQTGYSVDMLEADLDLEADLGIDTVKQVEVFGKVSDHFGLVVPEDLRLRDLNTIARLAAYIGRQAEGAEAGKKAGTESAPADTPRERSVSRKGSGVRRFVVRAETAPRPGPGEEDFFGATFLVTRDRFGFAEAAAAGIEARGGEAVLLAPEQISDPVAAAETVTDLLAEKGGIRGLIHLAPLDLVFDPEADENNGIAAVRTFFALVKSLGPVLGRTGGLLAMMSFSSVIFPYPEGVEDPGPIVPALAGMAGLMKSAAKEMPGARFKVVDFTLDDPQAQPEKPVDTFLAEIASTDLRVESGYAGGTRYVLALEEAPARPGESLVRPGDTVLVTGGARGITFEILKALVARTDLHLVILGRSEIPAKPETETDGAADLDGIIQAMRTRLPGARPVAIRKAAEAERRRRQTAANLQALGAAGVRVDYHAVDVTDADALAHILARYPQIDGVIHGAGIEISRLVAKKTQDEFDRVFLTKALGTRNLLEVLADRPWRYCCAFSSVTARFGNAAQADYTAANDMMGRMLQRAAQQDPARICKVLDWTAWEGTGMATDPTVRKVLRERGLTFLPLEEGVAFFMEELQEPFSGEAVFTGPDRDMDRDGLFASAKPLQETPAPFLDEVLARTPERTVFGRILDPGRDVFLLDHSREGVPIFLGATGIEAMAEAAAALCGEDRGPAELVDFAIPYGIKILKGRPKPIRIEAIRRTGGDATVACRILSRFVRPDGTVMGDDKLHYRGAFRFDPASLAPDPVRLPALSPVSLDTGVQELVYHPSRLFMDGVFRTVTEILFLDAQMLVTRLERPLGKPFFADVERPGFLTDVVMVDAMFQSCGILAFMTTGDVVLPQALGRMAFYRRPPRDGAILCRVKKTGGGKEHVTFGVDLTDARGNPFIAAEGFRMVRVAKLPADDPAFRQMRSARFKDAS